jgi:hypothetical protein
LTRATAYPASTNAWERSRTRRRHHERVDRVAAGVGEEERSERSTGRWRFRGTREHVTAVLIDHPRGTGRVARQEPHGAVGADGCASVALDVAMRVGDQVDRPGRRIQPVELGPALVLVTDEERGRVRPPLDREDGAREVDREVGPCSGLHVPDRRPLERSQLARERQALVSGHRGPRVGLEVRARIDEVAPPRSGVRIQDTKREMQDVAAFGVPDAQERSVRREPSGRRIRTTHPARERRGPQEARVLPVVVDVDPIVALDLNPDRGPVRVEREPREPPLGEIRQDRFRDATGRRSDQPPPLVAGPVAPPGETAVGQRPDPLVHPDRFLTQLLPRSRPEIVGPHLRDAAERGDQGQQARVCGRPRGEAQLRSGEAAHPRPFLPHRGRSLPSASRCQFSAPGATIP